MPESMPVAMPDALLGSGGEHCPQLTTQRNATHSRIQDQGSEPQVPDAPEVVDNPDSRFGKHVSMADLERTRAVLVELAQRQDELGRRLEASGLTDFADRADWLIAHRTPHEALAVQRRWARLFRRHRVPPERAPRRPAVKFASLSVPKARRTRQVIDPDRALQIALGAVPRESTQNRSTNT